VWMEKTEKFLRHVVIGSDPAKDSKNFKTWKQKYLYKNPASGELRDHLSFMLSAIIQA
jgi:hypothetical protein